LALAVNLNPTGAAARAEFVTAGGLMFRAAKKANLLGHHLANQVANMFTNKAPKYLNSFATGSLVQLAKQTKITHGGLPNG